MTKIKLEFTEEDLLNEEWRPVVGFEGYYEVSNLGRVKSIDREVWHSRNKSFSTLKGKILSQTYKDAPSCKYAKVFLRNQEIKKSVSVHRLVASSFIPNPQEKPQVNHIDGNTLNNRACNLEWATSSENIRHAFDTGLIVLPKGEEHHKAKLTESVVKEIKKRILQGHSQQRIANWVLTSYGIKVSRGTIAQIKRGARWKHVTID